MFEVEFIYIIIYHYLPPLWSDEKIKHLKTI